MSKVIYQVFDGLTLQSLKQSKFPRHIRIKSVKEIGEREEKGRERERGERRERKRERGGGERASMRFF